jgi:hypothetical protein
MDIIEMGNENMDWIKMATMAGFCEHGDELTVSINKDNFLIS